MGDWLRDGAVRLRGRKGRLVGGGVLADARHVITCAHVVNVALSYSKGRQACPVPPVPVEFLGNSEEPILATVEKWCPPSPDGTGDIAVLKLEEDAPTGCASPPMLSPETLTDHGFRVLGYPRGENLLAGGVEAKGEIRGPTGPGTEWHQLDRVDSAYRVQPGFSGSPVWDTTLEAVVGIAVAADYVPRLAKRALNDEAGFMIPIEVLARAWPDLCKQLGWRVRFDGPERETHWQRPVLDFPGGREPGFVGREEPLKRLVAWMRQPDGKAWIVNGGPGSGKSEVLRRLVVLADPDERARLEDVPAETVPPDDAVGLALVGRKSLRVDDVVSEIARWTGVAATDVEQLAVGLAERGEDRDPPLIVFDQLEEAEDPLGVASLLRRLVKEQGARVLVGLRSDDKKAVRDRFDGFAEVLDLDDDERLLEDLTRYVRALLSRGSKAYADDPQAAGRVAREVAEQASPSFLIARLVAISLVEADEVSERTPEEYPRTVSAAMDEYIVGIAERHPGSPAERQAAERETRDLLTALAYAEGPGLPADGEAWAAMAGAIGKPAEYAPERVAKIWDTAAAYLLQSRETAGTSVVRLFHPALGEALREECDDAAAQASMAAALSDLCSADSPEPAEAYVAQYLAAHVAEAGIGAWEALAKALHVLDRLDPGALTAKARQASLQHGSLPLPILGAIASSHLMEIGSPRDRAGLRQLGMARVGGRQSFGVEDAAPALCDWTIASAVLLQHPAHLPLETGSPVVDLAGADGPDGAFLAAGCEDGGVRLWSIARGRRISGPPHAHGAIRAVGACEVDGVPWVAIGDAEGYVRIWSPAYAGDPEGKVFPTGHGSGMRALVAFAAGGKLFVATGGDGNDVAVWRDGRPIATLTRSGAIRALAARTEGEGVEVLAGGKDRCVKAWSLPAEVLASGDAEEIAPARERTGPLDWIHAVCCFSDRDGPRVAAVGDDRALWIWGPAPRAAAAEHPAVDGEALLALTAYVSEARPWLVTAGRGRVLRLWDPREEKPHGRPLTGHREEISALAAYEVGGEASIASGDREGMVRVWAPREAEQRSEQAPGGARPVLAAVFCEGPEGEVAVTGDAEGTVRTWHPQSGAKLSSFRPGPDTITALVPCSADGRAGVAVGGDDGTLGFFDLGGEKTSPAGAPEIRHKDAIRAVALGFTVDGRAAIAAGGKDKRVRLWDRETHAPIESGTSRHWDQVRGLAVFEAPGKEAQLVVAGAGKNYEIRPVGRPESEPVEGHVDMVMAVHAYRSRGAPVLITGDDSGFVRIWAPLADEPPARLGVHGSSVRAIASFEEPGGRRLVATGGTDKTVRIWDPATRKQVRRFSLDACINVLDFSAAGILVGSDEGHLVIDPRLGQA